MEKYTGIKIAYIGGGSRGWARTLMNDLAKEPALSGEVALYDTDYAASKDNEKIGNDISARADAAGKWKYVAVRTEKEALIGADFVVISILPGTFDEMESDVHAPEKYGIYQSVGDTVGPGGAVRALRTVPMYIDIARDIERHCPEAWVINFTNPMTICTRSLYKAYPKIRAFGCCHEVFSVQDLIAAIYNLKTGENIKRTDVKTNVIGINHFTFIDRAFYGKTDLMPMVKEFAEEHYESGYKTHGEHWMNNSFACCERVKFDILKRYGILGAAGDRHLAEFCPGKWYLGSPENVKKWMFGLTSVKWRKDDLKDRMAKTERLVKREEQFKFFQSGEESVDQIKAILGAGDLVTNVNLPNHGQIEGFPSEAVVETNAVFTAGSISPVYAGKLPDPLKGLVLRNVMNQETLVEAAFNGDMELAFSAFVNDPLVNIRLDEARELFNTMTFNTRNYIPFYKKI